MTAQPHGPGTTPRGVGGAAPAATQALAALPLAAILVAAVAMRPHLGTTIASHWSGGAHPDGFSPTWGSFWVTVLVTAGLLVFSTVASTFARRASWSRVWPAIATTVGGMLACSWILSAWATAAAPSPAEATLGPRLVLLLPALACGAGIYLLLPPTPAPHTAGARRPVRQVQPGEA
ncbi:MAG TPA: hypothetical protein VFQ96_03365, partial [Microbacteriaceae bacterium]|nr:hypothetical protein [Microbacteriaceae bacterium]